MKTYTNSHGTKYTYKKTFIIRYIDENGLVKLIPDRGWRTDTRSEYEQFDTEDEALECLAKNEIHNGIVIPQINLIYL